MKTSLIRNVIYNLVAVLYWMSLYIYVPYVAPYLASLGIAASIIGYISSAYGMAMMLNRLPFGLIGGRTGAQKELCIAGIVFATIAAFGMRFTKAPALFMLFRFLSGVGVSAWTNFVTLYTSYFENEQSSKAVATMNLMANIGHIGAAVIGGIIADLFGYKEPFFFAGISGLLALVLSCGIVSNTKINNSHQTLGSLLAIGKEKSVLIAATFGIMLQLVPYATTYSFTNILAQEIGATEGQLGILQTITSIATIVAPLWFTSRFAERIPEKYVVCSAFLFYGISLVLFPNCTQVWQAFLLQFLSGLGFGAGCTPLMNLSIRFVALEKRSTALGFFLSIYALGVMLGPIIMGYFVDHWNYTVGYYIMAMASLATAFFVYHIFGRFFAKNSSDR